MRVVEDDHVDRLQVEVRQRMEPSNTNYPKASFISILWNRDSNARRVVAGVYYFFISAFVND
jgi:hypothetical protein